MQLQAFSIHQPFRLHGLEARPWVEVWVGGDLPGAVEERGQGSHGAPEGVVERHATADRVNLTDAADIHFEGIALTPPDLLNITFPDIFDYLVYRVIH